MSYWTEVDPPMSFIPEGWTYEQKRDFRYKMLPYLHETVRFERYSGKKVLCVGDGSGIDAVEFGRHGAFVHVIDMSEKAVSLSSKHAREAGAIAFKAVVGDATNLPYEPMQFDTVYSFGVIHHIPDVDKAVSEIARVLKPDGTFVGMVYHKDSLLYAYSILRRAEREGITAEEAMRLYSERNPGCPCSRAYTRYELSDLLLGHFQRLTVWPSYNVIDTEEKRKVPIDCPPDLGWHLFFEAHR